MTIPTSKYLGVLLKTTKLSLITSFLFISPLHSPSPNQIRPTKSNHPQSVIPHSTPPLRRLPPRHPQNLKDLLLAPPLHEFTLGNLHPSLAP